MKDDKAIEKILTIDIGGSNIKATVLSGDGNMLMDYEKIETPSKANPANMITAIEALTKRFESYDKVSVGFPGFVRNGVVFTAPNLGTDPWKGVELGKLLTEKLKKPVRLLNDA